MVLLLCLKDSILKFNKKEQEGQPLGGINQQTCELLWAPCAVQTTTRWILGSLQR